MYFDYKDTLILFGRSPYINEIKEYIPYLIQKWHTMGCNFFVDSFPDVEYVIFYDDIVPKVSKKNKIVTNIKHLKMSNKKSQTLCISNYKNTEFFKIDKVSQDTGFTKVRGCLNFYMHTPSMAMNWAWRKGFKNVILAGVDLNIKQNAHFDSTTTPDKNNCTLAEKTMMDARYHMEKIVTRYLNVFQLNLNNTMDLPKVKIQDLI